MIARATGGAGAIEAESFNAAIGVGMTVLLLKDSGEIVETWTRSEAYVSHSGHAVVFLAGVSGYYLADRVRPLDRLQELEQLRARIGL